MRKKLTVFLLLFLWLSAISVGQNPKKSGISSKVKPVTVTKVTPTSWTITKTNTMVKSNSSAGKGAGIGGAVGWLVRRSPVGIVAGAAVGAYAGGKNKKDNIQTEKEEYTMQGYQITLSDKSIYIRVLDEYKVGDRIDDISTIRGIKVP